ncbi:MAG: hypothetical protein IANPNBLG_01178 [Bryobacteraceae bacterium]|nr:hypothetical protein [Bryobacteraceae bacterium]
MDVDARRLLDLDLHFGDPHPLEAGLFSLHTVASRRKRRREIVPGFVRDRLVLDSGVEIADLDFRPGYDRSGAVGDASDNRAAIFLGHESRGGGDQKEEEMKTAGEGCHMQCAP